MKTNKTIRHVLKYAEVSFLIELASALGFRIHPDTTREAIIETYNHLLRTGRLTKKQIMARLPSRANIYWYLIWRTTRDAAGRKISQRELGTMIPGERNRATINAWCQGHTQADYNALALVQQAIRKDKRWRAPPELLRRLDC